MSKTQGHVLIVDDDPEVLISAEMFLEEHFQKVTSLNDPSTIPTALHESDPDVILLDMNFTRGRSDGKEGLDWLKTIRELAPETSVVLITAYGDVELAVKAIKRGAFDFVLKPWKNAKLLATTLSAYRYTKSVRQNKKLESTQEILQADTNRDFDEIIGESPAMQKLQENIAKVAPTDANVLILGENGTGKELIARAIHKQSLRKNHVFMPVDLGAITETLFESELFGHVKGAFTDAKNDKAGRFEMASGGTLFLDEIGNLPMQLQSKLLTAIQNHTINRVGSGKSIPVNLRIISATNSPLKELISEEKFRQDLYYRINTFEIEVPPLRDRKEDIPLLAEYFLEKLKKKYRKPKLKSTKRVFDQLEKHDWPGNIRELRNTLERAVILSEDNKLEISHLSATKNQTASSRDDLNLENNEKQLILKALSKHNGNITRAARELGLKRNALYRRLEKYDIQ
jgi:DNA-binding NtrC family response regulator